MMDDARTQAGRATGPAMTEPRQNRTMFSLRAFEFADIFDHHFAEWEHGALELTRLDGPSTAGGRQARQAMMLQVGDNARRKFPNGWLNTASKEAEVDPYEVAQEKFRLRFAGHFPILRDDYEGLLTKLATFLRDQDYRLTIAELPPPRPTAAVASPSPSEPYRSARTVSESALAAKPFLFGLIVGLALGTALGALAF